MIDLQAYVEELRDTYGGSEHEDKFAMEVLERLVAEVKSEV